MNNTYVSELIELSQSLTMRGLLLELQSSHVSTRYKAVLLMEFKKRIKTRKPLISLDLT